MPIVSKPSTKEYRDNFSKVFVTYRCSKCGNRLGKSLICAKCYKEKKNAKKILNLVGVSKAKKETKERCGSKTQDARRLAQS